MRSNLDGSQVTTLLNVGLEAPRELRVMISFKHLIKIIHRWIGSGLGQ